MRPRIRTIKPEFWHDEKIVALSRDARLLLLGLVTMADDEGRFRARRSTIIGHVFPDDEDAPALIDGWIKEIQEAKIVVFYVVSRTPYGAFRHWQRHQKISKPSESDLPAPPDRKVVRENKCERYDSSGNFKKTAIPERVRRAVAKAAGAIPGEETVACCHWCAAKGQIVWAKLADGRPGSWVSFRGLELDHVVPESKGGATDETNIVLACTSCNRTRGGRHGPSRMDSVSDDHGRNTDSPTRRRAFRSDPFPSDPILSLCKRLASHVSRNDPKAKPKPESERWQTDMRLLVEDRNGDHAEVERVIDWCQADSFWRSNVLSPGKLRKQFTQLVLKAQPAAASNGMQRPAALERMDAWRNAPEYQQGGDAG